MDRLSPEEIREEIDHESKYGVDRNCARERDLFGDEFSSEERASLTEYRPCTQKDIERFEAYWEDQVWCWQQIASFKGMDLSAEKLAELKAKDFAIWKNLRGIE